MTAIAPKLVSKRFGLLRLLGCFGMGSLLQTACFVDADFESSSGPDVTSGEAAGEESGSTSLEGETASEDTSATSAGVSTSADESTSGASALTSAGTTSTSAEGGESTGTADDISPPMPLTVDELEPGDLLVTEVMWNPTCVGDNCEWFELYNTTTTRISLQYLIVEDESGYQGAVTAPIIIEPEGFAILARTSVDWPYGFEYAAIYGPAPAFNNSLDRVIIRNDTTEIARTPLFPQASQGVSWGLRPEYMSPPSVADSARWCLSSTPLVTGEPLEYGTPLAPTAACL